MSSAFAPYLGSGFSASHAEKPLWCDNVRSASDNILADGEDEESLDLSEGTTRTLGSIRNLMADASWADWHSIWLSRGQRGEETLQRGGELF